MKRTMNGETSNAAIKRATDAGEYVYWRSTRNRWYVLRNNKIVVGEGLHPVHLGDCQMWVRSVEAPDHA